MDTDVSHAQLAVTERAATRIREILAGEEPGTKLRVAVSGGGCSGFKYDFSFDRAIAEDDLVVERDGAVILVDQVSLPFLEGSQLDFVDDLVGASFQIRNPQATASCGCGTSFAL